MTYSQINCFIEVVREGSMTKAANRLYISQPAISKSISQMEEELGFALFERNGKSMEATRAGMLLYEHYIRCREDFTRTLEQISASMVSGTPKLRIGCPDTWDPNVFYDRICAQFALHFPGINLELECFSLAELIIKLKGRKLDIAMTHDLYDVSQFGITDLKAAESICGVLYSKKAFPHITSVDDFADCRFLIYDVNLQKRLENTIMAACEKRFIPMTASCASQSAALFETARGSGVMFFTDWDSMLRSDLFGFFRLNVTMPVSVMYLTEEENAVGHYARSIVDILSC